MEIDLIDRKVFRTTCEWDSEQGSRRLWVSFRVVIGDLFWESSCYDRLRPHDQSSCHDWLRPCDPDGASANPPARADLQQQAQQSTVYRPVMVVKSLN